MSDTPIDAERVRREQREFWNNAAPGWREMFRQLERAGQGVSDRLIELARIKPGDRVLDIATGSGEPGISAARKVGATGRVVATDQAPAMLELARERARDQKIANIEFAEADAESLAIADKDFDAAVCRWGLMFVPNIDVATRRVAALLKPGAYFATSVWGPAERVPLISVGEDAVRAIANTPPPPKDAPHPLKLADTRPLERALAGAGFKDVAIEPINVKFEFPSAEAFFEMRRQTSSPFRALLAKQPAEMLQKIQEAVSGAARKFADSTGVVRMDNEAVCISAHR